MRNIKFIYITHTAVMLALLIGVQLITHSFGQLVTESIVNLILLISVFMIGIYGGLTVAVLSPILSYLAGIEPAVIEIIPFIAIGNVFFVTIAWLMARKSIYRISTNNSATSIAAIVGLSFGSTPTKDIPAPFPGLVVASLGKFLFLRISIVQFVLPLIPELKENQVAVLSLAFSWPQLVTAFIGSMLAMVIIPQLKKAIK